MKKLLLMLTALLSLFETEARAEAYAVWCESNYTLYFTNRSETLVEGGKFVPEGGLSIPITKVFSGKDVTNSSSQLWSMGMKSVVFATSFKDVQPQSTRSWFSGCGGLTSIKGIENLNTSEVTDMSSMFMECSSLKELDLSTFDTKKVKSFFSMFAKCESLQSLKQNFDVSSATDFSSMFRECKGLEAIDLSNFKSNRATSTAYMFLWCENLVSVDLSNFVTNSVTDMTSMFSLCTKLPTLDISSFNTSKVTNMTEMFAGDVNLATIFISSGWSTQSVTESEAMFGGCENLTNYYDYEDKTYAYAGGDGFGYLTFKPGATPAEPDEEEEQAGPYAVLSENNTVLTFYNDNKKAERGGMAIKPFEKAADRGWNEYAETIVKVVFDITMANYTDLTSTAFWFYDFKKLTGIEGLSNLKTYNVTDMKWMFYNCQVLESLDLSKFETDNVTSMLSMFFQCMKLKQLDLRSFNTSKVVDMTQMFDNCANLKDLYLDSFDTQNVTNMNNMFYMCSSLKVLDISSFNTAKLERPDNMFQMCGALTTILVGDGWSMSSVKYNCDMFNSCSSLVGEDGTTWSEDKIKYTFAHTNEGGYLTKKTVSLPLVACQDGNWATYYNKYLNTRVPEGDGRVKVYTVKVVDGKVTTTLVGTAIIPKDTPVLLQCHAAFPIQVTRTTIDAAGDFSGNELIGTHTAIDTPENAYTLTKGESSFDFSKSTDATIPAQSAYLVIASNQQDEIEAQKTNLKAHCDAMAAFLKDKEDVLKDKDPSQESELWSKIDKIKSAINDVYLEINEVTNMEDVAACQNKIAVIETELQQLSDEVENYEPAAPTTFTAKTIEGVEVTFKVISEEEKTVQVGTTEGPAIDTATSGSVTIPATVNGYSVIQIAASAFKDCKNLKAVTLPESITFIGIWAFAGTSLTTIEIPEHVTTIAYQAFTGCKQLESINLPHSLGIIASYAFSDCPNLNTIYSSIAKPFDVSFCFSSYQTATVYVPIGTKALYEATDGWKNFKNIVEMGQPIFDVEAVKLSLKNELENIVKEIEYLKSILYDKDPDYDAKELWNEIYDLQKKSAYVAIMIDGITGEEDFNKCEESIAILEKLSIQLKDEIEKYEPTATTTFTAKTIEGVEVTFKVISEEEKTVQVGTGKYDERAIDTSTSGIVTIPATIDGYSVVAIADGAFKQINNLQQVIIPEGVKTLGEQAFYYSSNISAIELPASVTGIGYVAFGGCTNAKTIRVAEGNKVYDSRNDCNAIIHTSSNQLVLGCANTVIPEDVTSLGTLAFCDSRELKTIKLPAGLTSIGGWGLAGTQLTTVEIPEQVTYLGYMAFKSCKQLISINLPASMKGISSYAFLDCPNLSSIHSYIAEPFTIPDDAFETYETTTLYVPAGTKALYEATDGWKNFKNIVEMVITPMDKNEEVDYGSESNVNKDTDFSGTVIDNVYYNITPDKGGFDENEKCIVVNEAMSDEDVEAVFGKDLMSDDVKNKFTGIVIEVPAGKGKLTVNAQTFGGMTLKIKIGKSAPIKQSFKNGKTKIKVPYNVKEPTYIYIYAGEVEAQVRATRASGGDNPSLKIYGFGIEPSTSIAGDADGDEVVDVNDVVSIVNHILSKTAVSFNEEAADVNGDGSIDVADVVATVNIILGKSSGARSTVSASTETENDHLSLTGNERDGYSLSLDNAGGYQAAQFDIRLTDGQTLEAVRLNMMRCGNHQMAYAKIDEGLYRVLIYNIGGEAFDGNDGELLRMDVAGSGDLTVSDIKFITDGQAVRHFAPLSAGTTGINTITLLESPADIYSLDGRLIRKQASNTEGLKNGMYIINNKKIIIR